MPPRSVPNPRFAARSRHPPPLPSAQWCSKAEYRPVDPDLSSNDPGGDPGNRRSRACLSTRVLRCETLQRDRAVFEVILRSSALSRIEHSAVADEARFASTGSPMLRLTLSTVVLVGILATTQPGFANSLPAATSNSVQAATAGAPEQPAPPVSAWSPSSDATAPVGFGWG